jgi:gluconate 2-dehydrogenase gamma chain
MLGRRSFVKIISVTGAFFLLLFNACRRIIDLPDNYALTRAQAETLQMVHEHLFPGGSNSPGVSDINSVDYVKKILTDPQVKTSRKKLILFGINWTNETAVEMYNAPFISLSSNQKEGVVKDLIKYKNGERWVSYNLTYILEALLADPIYGGNTNQSGWNWLKHQPGYPRPDLRTKYQHL